MENAHYVKANSFTNVKTFSKIFFKVKILVEKLVDSRKNAIDKTLMNKGTMDSVYLL